MIITERMIAGFFVGVGSVALIFAGRYSEAQTILIGMLAFFIGERNGMRKASQNA